MTSASTSSKDATAVPPIPEEQYRLPTRQPPPADRCWLHREQPGPGQPHVILAPAALTQIQAHCHSDLYREVGGALLGRAYRHEDRVYLEIHAALPATSRDHGPVHFTFSADSWTQLQRDKEAHHPNLDIVGWFHTHPDLGVFYSSDDVVVHSAAFTLPWHVGIVIDPVRQEIGIFGWIKGQLAPLAGFYELLDAEAPARPQMPWRAVRTAVWYDTAEPDPPAAPRSREETRQGVYMPNNPRPLFGAATPAYLGAVLGGISLLLALLLLFGGVLPLSRQNARLETAVLTLADAALAETNAATCPDARLRILTPVSGTTVPRHDAVSILGAATYPDAARYRVEVRPQGVEQWTIINSRRRAADLAELAGWNTSDYVPGPYEIRLIAVDNQEIRIKSAPICAITVTVQAE